MGRNINNTKKLTKDYILSKVSQITIFSTYFNLNVSLIQHCIDTGQLIVSPIRFDNHPTCGFRYDSKGKLKFKDFSGYFWGDCFDAVAFVMTNMYNKPIDISNKEDFLKVLNHITFTFKDIFYGNGRDINLINNINDTVGNMQKIKPVIEIVTRNWNEEDYNYWHKFGITINWLNINFVYPVEQYYIDRKVNPYPKYFYNKTPNDKCYAYFLGKDKYGITNIKLYFPDRDKNAARFICNCNHLEGIYNLELSQYNYIILTKSSKDRLSLGCIFNYLKLDYNIGVINIPHETYKLRQNEYDWLVSKLPSRYHLISLMDNDRTGKCESIWLRQNYGIIPMLIPSKYNSKDFAELVSNNDKNEIINIINNTIKTIKDYVENYKHLRESTDLLSLPY